jgi:hypothetical protein
VGVVEADGSGTCVHVTNPFGATVAISSFPADRLGQRVGVKR